MTKIYKYGVAIASTVMVFGSLALSAGATTVEEIFPTASVSAIAVGMLTRYVSLLLQFWPLFIGVAVVFAIVYLLLRKAKGATHGRIH